MLSGYRVKVVLTEDGKLQLDDLPFSAGDTVEVVFIPHPAVTTPPESLRGTVTKYERPFDPAVPPEDWGVEKDWSFEK